jgi:hypothetical protein
MERVPLEARDQRQRYDPPGRASNRSNLPIIPPGGSHASSASGSTRAAQAGSGGAAITRDALSVRGIP